MQKYISKVPGQNGVSQAWYIVEIHHSGRKPSICAKSTNLYVGFRSSLWVYAEEGRGCFFSCLFCFFVYIYLCNFTWIFLSILRQFSLFLIIFSYFCQPEKKVKDWSCKFCKSVLLPIGVTRVNIWTMFVFPRNKGLWRWLKELCTALAIASLKTYGKSKLATFNF